MGPIAIIGAAGFVGTRLVETCLLGGITDIRPVVRKNQNLARLCRYGINEKIWIADAENEGRLSEAIKDCPIVINLISGDPNGIVQSTKVLHQACVKSGVKRLIHLSSAVVYGRVESPDVHENSPLVSNHWMPYARAKISAEHFLNNVAGISPFEIVMLRPGIVWGPRSRWSLNAAQALRKNTAYIVEDGSGICNTIYVDNLVASILVCCEQATDVSGAYNVADTELVSWYDFYASLAGYFSYDMTTIPRVPSDRFHPTLDTLIQDFTATALYHKLKKSISLEQRAKIKRILSTLKHKKTITSATQNNGSQPENFIVSRDMWNLQQTKYKLPTNKFAEKFNFTPPVSFDVGTQMTINWLHFIGT